MISPVFSIGPIKIHYYGIIIALAVYVGWALAKRRAPKYKIPREVFDDPIILLIIFLALVGARLYHVLDYWTRYYSYHPIMIFYISNGGIGIWGALFGGLLGLYLVVKIKKLPLISLLDLLMPSLVLAQAIGRIGNFINQEGFGPPTNLPWGVFISPAKRPLQFASFSYFHPTFFYEAILDIFIFFVLLKIAKKTKIPGLIFSLYLLLYSLSRFFIEFYRIDTWTIGTVKIAQVLGILTFFAGLYLFYFFKKRALDID